MAQVFLQEELEKFLEAHPNSVKFAHYGARLLETGELEKAKMVCEDGIKKHPAFAFGHFVLALVYNEEKNFTDAKRELEFALALDAAIPEAWNLLARINENLNLALMAKESYFKYYMSDCFNTEAADKFLQEEVSTMMDSAEDLLPTTEDAAVDEIGLDSIFEEAGGGETGSEDFEQTLDEVFQDSLLDVTGETEAAKPAMDDSLETADEAKPREDKFSDAMDSFFSEYEGKSEEYPTEEGEIPAEPVDSGKGEETVEFPIDFVEKTDIPDVPGDLDKKAKIKDDADEEPIDFSSVVADIISDRKEQDETGGIEESSGTVASEAIEEQVPTESISEKYSEEGQEVKDTLEAEKPEKKGKPPILSPTLGEIYIAQGRFEEAIGVFQELLEKEPGNARYERKINDLQNIIKKQKSKPGQGKTDSVS